MPGVRRNAMTTLGDILDVELKLTTFPMNEQQWIRVRRIWNRMRARMSRQDWMNSSWVDLGGES